MDSIAIGTEKNARNLRIQTKKLIQTLNLKVDLIRKSQSFCKLSRSGLQMSIKQIVCKKCLWLSVLDFCFLLLCYSSYQRSLSHTVCILVHAHHFPALFPLLKKVGSYITESSLSHTETAVYTHFFCTSCKSLAFSNKEALSAETLNR